MGKSEISVARAQTRLFLFIIPYFKLGSRIGDMAANGSKWQLFGNILAAERQRIGS
jgi:hypothetical protein